MIKSQVYFSWPMLLLVLAACAAPTPVPTTPTAMISDSSAIAVAIASNDFGVGAPRVPIVLFRESKPLAEARFVTLTAFDLSSGTPVPGWSGEAASYSDYEIPYWVMYPQLPKAGEWGFVADIALADGTRTEAQFIITVVEASSAPDVGDTPPASDNRTLQTEPELAKLTSDPAPEPGLYQLSVAEAVKSGQPTVVTFATPAFCESRLCAPVVDSVKAVYSEFKGSANFIHIEVYKTFNPLVYADEMEEWHMTSEPWTFVLDKTGKVTARLGGPVSPRELEAVLALVIQP